MILKLIGFLSIFTASSFAVSAPIDPLIGTWQIIDQRTGYYVSDIIIRKESSSQQYLGVINKAYPRPNTQSSELCVACEGAFKNQPLFGMQTLKALKKTKQARQYSHGVWLNPQNGIVYEIDAMLNSNQDQMRVNAKSQSGQNSTSLIWKKL